MNRFERDFVKYLYTEDKEIHRQIAHLAGKKEEKI